MAKHNYTQYANKNKVENEVVEETVIAEAPEVEVVTNMAEVTMMPEIDLVEETVETVAVPNIPIAGTVVNCSRLNVRAEASADADIVCVLNGKSEVEIDVDKSTRDWFYVYTAAGLEGYCMKKFVDARV